MASPFATTNLSFEAWMLLNNFLPVNSDRRYSGDDLPMRGCFGFCSLILVESLSRLSIVTLLERAREIFARQQDRLTWGFGVPVL